MRVFGDLLAYTCDDVDWRIHSRQGRFQSLIAYYPGFTPADRSIYRLNILCADAQSSKLTGHQVTWHEPHGRHTYTAQRDCPESAVAYMEKAIKRIVALGDSLIQDPQPRQQRLM